MNTNLLINYSAFAILTVLWLGFGALLAFNREALDTIWAAFRAFPAFLQALVGLLLLPLALGLWIWETSWPVWLRLIIVAGLGAATIYTFYPRQG